MEFVTLENSRCVRNPGLRAAEWEFAMVTLDGMTITSESG
jgi:hypothetical protein